MNHIQSFLINILHTVVYISNLKCKYGITQYFSVTLVHYSNQYLLIRLCISQNNSYKQHHMIRLPAKACNLLKIFSSLFTNKWCWCTGWPAKDRNRTVFAYNARSATRRFLSFLFGRFFRKCAKFCEHVTCVENIRQKHNKHRETDTKKKTGVGVTLLAHK